MKKKVVALIFLVMFFMFVPFCYGACIDIASPAAILADSSSGKILYEKNSNEKMYPASTTKILTAIIALEKCNLQDEVIVSEFAVSSVPDTYGGFALNVDETLTVEQLLNVLMIASSNIAGNALAEHIAGSTENFATLMNEKATSIGCKNSNFTNPYGLHDENHYSTAFDLYLIASYAMKNRTFRNIVSKPYYTLQATNKNSNTRTVNNTNELLRVIPEENKPSFFYPYTIGIKTGFTNPAKDCLVAAAKKDNFEIITVILGSDTSNMKYSDTIKLFNYAYNNYEYGIINDINTPVSSVVINNAKNEGETLDVYAENQIYALLEKNNSNSEIHSDIKLNKNLSAPIRIGDIVGNVEYEVMGIKYTTKLIALNNIEAMPWYKQLFRAMLKIISK